jgi:hypothetical protein
LAVPRFLDLNWQPPRGVRAAFTLRTGGASRGAFASFNTARHVGDDVDAVANNRAALREALDLPAEPAWLNQVHGTAVKILGEPARAGTLIDPAGGAAGSADAAVARERGHVCVIQVADCLPVLLATRDGQRIGAAHAGWRGLSAGVLEATVRELHAQPADLVAWLGPAIHQASFEVGDDVRAAFLAHSQEAASAFVANARGRWQCDLIGLARQRLRAVGVEEIAGGDWCTYEHPTKFFSYRRDGQCGRMAALIWRD